MADLNEIERMLSSLEVDTDDFIGQLPFDITDTNFCQTDTPMVEEPDMTMKDIEDLINSDMIQKLMDASAMAEMVQNMCDEAVANKKPPVDKMSCEGKIGIIEFGDDYTNGDKVNYELWVKPGQIVDSSTQFGLVEQEDEFRIMQSIFSTGKIMSTDIHDTEFLRLFPDKAKRHILICNYAYGDGIGFDQDEVDKVSKQMEDNSEIFNLLKDQMVPSSLPLILSNHELKSEHVHTPLNPCSLPKPKDIYNLMMEKYFDIIDSYNKQYKKLCTSKNIKAAGGTASGTRALGDKCLAIRESMLQDIIKHYMTAHNNGYSKIGCDGETGYDDCLNLGSTASGLSLKYNDIKTSYYSNYYVYLLSSVQTDSENIYVKEYVQLLKEIMENRARYEKVNQTTVKDEFNTLYKKYINSKSKDGFSDLIKASTSTSTGDLQSALGKLVDAELQRQAETLGKLAVEIRQYKEYLMPNVKNPEWQKRHDSFNSLYHDFIDTSVIDGYEQMVKGHKDNAWYTVDNVKGYVIEKNQKYMKSDNSYATIMMHTRLARIAQYITSIDKSKFKITEEFNDEYTPLDLVQEEADKIRNFWLKLINEYNSKPMSAMVKSLEDMGEELTKFAKWPQPVDITINGQPYEHWLFKNPFEDKDKNIPDDGDPGAADYDADNINIEDMQSGKGLPNGGNLDDTSGISEPDTDAAQEAMKGHGAAMQSANDPAAGEITIVDTAYWVKYFAMATLITLPFFADGLDIPPTMTPVPLPGIYIAFKAIHIKIFDVVLVIGLAIRGMYISPILLTVNLSDQDVSPLLPLVAILKQVREMFSNAINMIEMTIPNLVGILIMKLEKENQQYREKNIMYNNMLKTLESQMVENEQQLKKNMRRIQNVYADVRQNIFRTEDVAAN